MKSVALERDNFEELVEKLQIKLNEKTEIINQ